jgi:hypothetical protein
MISSEEEEGSYSTLGLRLKKKSVKPIASKQAMAMN